MKICFFMYKNKVQFKTDNLVPANMLTIFWFQYHIDWKVIYHQKFG